MKRAILAGMGVISLLFSGFGISESNEGPATLQVRLSADNPSEMSAALSRLGFDVAGLDLQAKTVDVLTSETGLSLLRDRGFDLEILADRTDLSILEGEVAALDPYVDPQEALDKLKALEKQYPTLAKLEIAGKSLEGFPIAALKISDNVAVDEGEPSVFFNGSHHAREVMTPEVVLDTAEYLLSSYASDAKVKAWVDNAEIWVMPHVNPDGAFAVFKGDLWWRKNRRSLNGTVVGVDINRNYPIWWDKCPRGSSTTPTSQTYRGEAPASEPEAQAVVNLVRKIRPTFSISYHSYSELVLYPYGCNGKKTADDATIAALGKELAAATPRDQGTGTYTPGIPWQILYEVQGDDISWMYTELGVFPFVFELNQSFQPDYATIRDKTVQKLRKSWGMLLDRVTAGPMISGTVKDQATGKALQAQITLSSATFGEGETPRMSSASFGRFYWPVLPGTHTVTISKPGYASQQVAVTVGQVPAKLEVALKKASEAVAQR